MRNTINVRLPRNVKGRIYYGDYRIVDELGETRVYSSVRSRSCGYFWKRLASQAKINQVLDAARAKGYMV